MKKFDLIRTVAGPSDRACSLVDGGDHSKEALRLLCFDEVQRLDEDVPRYRHDENDGRSSVAGPCHLPGEDEQRGCDESAEPEHQEGNDRRLKPQGYPSSKCQFPIRAAMLTTKTACAH